MFNIDMDKIKEKAISFKDVAAETFLKTVNAAERAATVAKVKFKITSKETDIKNKYREIGKIVYSAYSNDTDADNEQIAEKCVAIDTLNEEIASLKASIAPDEEKTNVVAVSEKSEETCDTVEITDAVSAEE